MRSVITLESSSFNFGNLNLVAVVKKILHILYRNFRGRIQSIVYQPLFYHQYTLLGAFQIFARQSTPLFCTYVIYKTVFFRFPNLSLSVSLFCKQKICIKTLNTSKYRQNFVQSKIYCKPSVLHENIAVEMSHFQMSLFVCPSVTSNFLTNL